MHMTDNCVSVNVCWARTLLLIKKRAKDRARMLCFKIRAGRMGH